MGCSSCGKKFAAKSGSTVFVPIILGESIENGDVYKVELIDDNLVADWSTGDVIYVTGTGVQPAADDELLTILETSVVGGVRSGSRLYCVTVDGDKTCYSTLHQARHIATQAGVTISVETA